MTATMVGPLSAALIRCLKSFNQIQEQVEHPETIYEGKVSPDSWTDELGRLRVWAANIGAHQTGQSSLEFRLRDASHISHQITRLLEDLTQILEDIIGELSEIRTEPVKDDTTSDCWPDEIPPSELQQLYEEVVNIIDCLYQMSMLIRKPSQHDHLTGCHKSDAAAFEPFDRDHVRNKYLKADDGIVHRLGRAITQRRRYLKYRDRHHAKLGKGIEEAQGIQRRTTESLMFESIATDFENQNIDFEQNTSNSGMSQTSYAPSLVDGGAITIPSPPKESASGKPFKCPYCFFVIDIKGTRSWTRHIFKDIKPYVYDEEAEEAAEPSSHGIGGLAGTGDEEAKRLKGPPVVDESLPGISNQTGTRGGSGFDGDGLTGSVVGNGGSSSDLAETDDDGGSNTSDYTKRLEAKKGIKGYNPFAQGGRALRLEGHE